MDNDSNSEVGVSKALGIVASVLAILAFFGIANWQDLKGSETEDAGNEMDLADVGVGDCFKAQDLDWVAASCDDPSEHTYTVLGRVMYDEATYAEYYGHPAYTENGMENLYEATSCAVALGWNFEDTSKSGRIAVSIYTENGREVLCGERA